MTSQTSMRRELNADGIYYSGAQKSWIWIDRSSIGGGLVVLGTMDDAWNAMIGGVAGDSNSAAVAERHADEHARLNQGWNW